MLHRIPHPVSEGLRKENEVHRQRTAQFTTEQVRSLYPTAQDFCRYYTDSAEGAQMRQALHQVRPGATVLDIGAGYGGIAIYLASQGYRVTAVEPSLHLCQHIERLAVLYRLPLEIYNVSAEYVDRLPVRPFHVCMFNASLHHCDDPRRALLHCYKLLAPGGQLFLLNEPLLQFFRSKAWFQRRLRQGDLVVGDYGGNEHTYYYHEYVAMLRQAGFRHINDLVALRYRNPASYLACLQASGAKRLSVLLRKLCYRVIGRICQAGVCGRPALYVLKRLSLLQTDFTATKLVA